MNNTELCYLPATEALQLFRTHKLSPLELLEAQIKRADQVEPIINAFTDTFYDDALKKAKAAEKRYKDAARSYLDHLFGRMLARAYEESPDLLCDYTKYYAQSGQYVYIDPKAEMVIVKFSSLPKAIVEFAEANTLLGFDAIAKSLI